MGGIGVSAIKVVTGLLYATVEVSPIGYVMFEILVIVFISVHLHVKFYRNAFACREVGKVETCFGIVRRISNAVYLNRTVYEHRTRGYFVFEYNVRYGNAACVLYDGRIVNAPPFTANALSTLFVFATSLTMTYTAAGLELENPLASYPANGKNL